MDKVEDLKGMLRRTKSGRDRSGEALGHGGTGQAVSAENNVAVGEKAGVTVEQMNEAVAERGSRAGKTGQ